MPENVQISLPRKGTETAGTVMVDCWATAAFKSHYPARGRKRGNVRPDVPVYYVFKSHYPARGRKQENYRQTYPGLRSNLITPQGDGNLLIPLVSLNSLNCSNLITPQGDGNSPEHDPHHSSDQVQISLPRKGTETLNLTHQRFFGTSSNLITPQGDGN